MCVPTSRPWAWECTAAAQTTAWPRGPIAWKQLRRGASAHPGERGWVGGVRGGGKLDRPRVRGQAYPRSCIATPVAHSGNERGEGAGDGVIGAVRAGKAERVVDRALQNPKTASQTNVGLSWLSGSVCVDARTCDMYSMFSEARRSSPKWMWSSPSSVLYAWYISKPPGK